MNEWIWTTVLTLLPIAELRGGIPFALANGIPLALAYPYCVILNALVAPLAYLFLDTAHRFLNNWGFYHKIFDYLIVRASRKVGARAARYGFWGLTLFVAIPFPVTGAWTGTMGAWVLGLGRKRTILAVGLGVMFSGAIVSMVSFFGIETLHLFIRNS